ncbi:hypothetical protein SKAU_G00166530 [Synaphobranchus kaupii]|uniref:F-box/WD repeat-containing protein 4 n=1 Tax=Synaphobranchus kaupii TaxID=118154 RepID=A0A9Q1FJJ4_SYNKA|nr:hypothetical protein SKAU_G00166530 [Synaphobranchus kaupii]
MHKDSCSLEVEQNELREISLTFFPGTFKTFHHFTNRDVVWRRIARKCINTGLTRQGTDMYPQLPLKDRVKVSQHWRKGQCREEILLKWKTNLLPWMQLDGDVLYLSQAADIGVYYLQGDQGRLRRKPVLLHTGHSEDVCRFVLTDTHLISAGGDGKIILHHRRNSFWVECSGHNQEVNCIDSKGGVIVSGSRDRTARIWALSSNRLGECLHTIQTFDRVWSVAISPSQSTFATGTACCENFAPLRIWDIERCQMVSCLGSSTCGYDTFIRYWDLRVTSRKCVMQWEEPHDSALYCIQTDGNHMIASGSSYYGVVRLWDKRQTSCLQTFYLSSATSSPVYCLRFNALPAVLCASYLCMHFRFQRTSAEGSEIIASAPLSAARSPNCVQSNPRNTF